ncbi:MAG: hypothetical protein ACHQ6T_17705 [Myxococcota bacterium]
MTAAPVRAGNIPLEEPPPAKRTSVSAAHVAWMVLMYLPNRVFDLTDIVRVQVRAGPGWAFGVRATRALPLFIGGYDGTWLGMPGPRGRASVPLPFGTASQSGFSLGPANSGGSQAPYYGAGEFGAGAHLYMLGFDFGFDVYELADFFAGFACVDIAHDDF